MFWSHAISSWHDEQTTIFFIWSSPSGELLTDVNGASWWELNYSRIKFKQIIHTTFVNWINWLTEDQIIWTVCSRIVNMGEQIALLSHTWAEPGRVNLRKGSQTQLNWGSLGHAGLHQVFQEKKNCI